MSSLWTSALAFSLFAIALPSSTALRAEPLGLGLEQFQRSPSLRGARLSVAVLPLEGEPGAYRTALEPERALVPASNQKILLTAAVLDHFGPAHRFETALLAERPLSKGGVLDGPLYVKGSGDPSLVTEQIWRIAEELRLLGVREITGGITVDATYFDGLRAHPDWAPVSRRAFHAPVSAFAANYSSFRTEIIPGDRPGAPAAVRVAPELPYFRVSSDVVTRKQGGSLSIDVIALPDLAGERVDVRGSFSLGQKPKSIWRAVALPEVYAASLLRGLLEAQGVRVHGGIRVAPLPEGAVELLRFRGAALGEIVRDQNKWSNNFVAEQLTKVLGAAVYGEPGSWATGARAIRAYVERQGLEDPALTIIDGSGLSTRNRVSAATLASVIRIAATDFRFGPEFLASLPLGGLDGTLEDRMERLPGEVRGKTGHLSAASSLSGVTRDEHGALLAFAVLVNGARGGSEDVDEAIDRLIASFGPQSRVARGDEIAESPSEEPPSPAAAAAGESGRGR